MTDEPQPGGDGRPKLTNSLTGWIGGITGVVIALTGLVTAINALRGNSQGPSQESNSEATTETADVESTESSEAATTEEAAAPAALPEYYSGAATLRLDGRDWVFNEGEANEARYEQKGGREDGWTYATNYNRDYELRWPNEGGSLDEKKADEDWNPIGNVDVDQPAAAEEAAEE